MASVFEVAEESEKVILIGVSTHEHDDTEESIEELKDLVRTAGAVPVATVIQNRETVHSGTYIGKGKIEEVKLLLDELDATGIVCDDELSPAQLTNLRDMLDTKGPDIGDIGYICSQGKDRRRKDTGGTGTVKIQAGKAGGTAEFFIQTGRRNRNQRTW